MTTGTESGMTTFAQAVEAVRGGADPDQRAAGLLEQMTEGERLSLLDGDEPFWPGMANMMRIGYNLEPITAGEIPRLGVPGVRFSDGPRGAVIGQATAFPVTMARGATWDPDLEERDRRRDRPRAARPGRQPLRRRVRQPPPPPGMGPRPGDLRRGPAPRRRAWAPALTRGVQRHVMACVKHFACNSMENARFTGRRRVDEAACTRCTCRTSKRIVDEGVASVMSAYNSGQRRVVRPEPRAAHRHPPRASGASRAS